MRKSIAALCFLLITYASSAQLFQPAFDLQGHRGARGLYPENTVPAFVCALDSGVTTVELDVVITRDRQVLVSHEPWMSSSICLQPGGSEISEADEKLLNIFEMDYDEVRRFDCGSIGNEDFPGQTRMHVSKPLFRDVIAAVEHHIKSLSSYEVDYNIEIKASPSGDNKFHPTPEVFSDLVYNVIDQYLSLERVVIQSFDFRVLKYWHTKYPEVRLSALIQNAKTVDSNLQTLGFQPSVYSPHYKLLTKEKVDHLKGLGIRVIPWTVNEISDMKRMVEWKVNGFITDYPDRAATLGLGIRKPRTGSR